MIIHKGIDSQILLLDGYPEMIIPYDVAKRRRMSEVVLVDYIDDIYKILEKPDISLNVLNVGLGAGYTAAALTLKKYIEKIDIVEIDKEIISNLNYFETYNLINGRCNIFHNDIADYIKTTNNIYDVIVIDMCRPQHIASTNLFRDDFLISIKNIMSSISTIIVWYGYIYNDELLMYKNTLHELFNKNFTFVDFRVILKSYQIEKDNVFIASNFINIHNH